MIPVYFDPDLLTDDDREWWDCWLRRAEKAKQQALTRAEAGEKPNLDREIWSDLKNWLRDRYFHGKCAYCEGEVRGVSFGSADHYRPKAKVTVRDSSGKDQTVCDHSGAPHAGYYWLAYDWQNLLPACDFCNSANGKMNQFPTARPHIFDPAIGPDTRTLNEREQPLLLHPYFDEPADHLKFGLGGVVTARDGSARGEHSIQVYDLRREELNTARRIRQEEARHGLMLALLRFETFGIPVDETLDSFIGQAARFSQAVTDYLSLEEPSIINELEKLRPVRVLADSESSKNWGQEDYTPGLR